LGWAALTPNDRGWLSRGTWEHSHVVVDDDGLVRTFCVYAAPDEETVRRHAAALSRHEIVALHEIAGDVTPADFPT
jgi:Protein of unknown function (DUF4242)